MESGLQTIRALWTLRVSRADSVLIELLKRPRLREEVVQVLIVLHGFLNNWYHVIYILSISTDVPQTFILNGQYQWRVSVLLLLVLVVLGGAYCQGGTVST